MIQLHKFNFKSHSNIVIEQILNDTEKRRTGNYNSARDTLANYSKQFEDNLSNNNVKSAAVILRFFSELYVKEYCAKNEINCDGLDSSEKINILCSKGFISREMSNSLHTLRKIGNAGAHDEKSPELDNLLLNSNKLRSILQSLICEYDNKFDTRLQVAKDVFCSFIGSVLHINVERIVLMTEAEECYYDKAHDTQKVSGFLGFIGFPSVILAVIFEVSNFAGDNLKIASINITACDGKTLVFSSGEDVELSLWVKETKLQAELYPFLRANDPCQDMSESYYEKNYYASDDFNILYALIDILASMPNQGFSIWKKTVLICKDGLKMLTKKQRIKLVELKRMSQTFASISIMLCSSLVGEDAQKMKEELYQHYTYWNNIYIFGKICKKSRDGFEEKDYFFDNEEPIILISDHFEKLGFHLGYEFVSKKEQYIILLSTSNVTIKSFRIKPKEKLFLYPRVCGFEYLDIDHIYSTKFDYDAFFKECMEQGFKISAATRMNQISIRKFKSENRVVTSNDINGRRIRRVALVAILLFGAVSFGFVQNRIMQEKQARKEQIVAERKKNEIENYQMYKDTFISSPEEALAYLDELLPFSDAYFEEDDISQMLLEFYKQKEGETQYSYKVLGYYFLQRKETKYDAVNNRLGIVYEQSVTKPNYNYGPVYKVYEFDNLRIVDGVFTYDVVGACNKPRFSGSLSRTGVAYYYNSDMVGHALVFTNSKYGTDTCIFEKHINVELSNGETEVWMSDDLLEHQGDWISE